MNQRGGPNGVRTRGMRPDSSHATCLCVRLLRRGGGYLEARVYWAWVGLAMLGLAMAGVLIVAFHTTPWLLLWLAIAFPTLFSATLLGVRNRIRSLVRTQKGRLGERLVTNLLARLPDDYCLVNDLVLGTRGNIDHVLVGPCGVVVIETKRVSGHIRCDGDSWWRNNRPVKSYSKQAKAAAIAVKHFLETRYPKTPYVEAIVVFTDPLCRLDINRAQVTAVRYSELLAVVHELARRHHLEAALAHTMASSLAAAPQRARP